MNLSTQQHALGESMRASGPARPMAPGMKYRLRGEVIGVWGAVLSLLLVAFIALLSGCSSEQVEQYRAANAELKAALVETNAKLAQAQTLIDRLDDQIDVTPDGPEKQAAVEARDRVVVLVDQATEYAAQLTEGIEQTDAAITAALAGDAAGAVNTIGPYLASKAPPPWNIYILTATTVLGGVLTYVQKRKTEQTKTRLASVGNDLDFARSHAQATRVAAESVITAIEREKSNDGVVNFQGETTKISLRSRMSSEARKLVEDVRQAQPARLTVLNAETAPGNTT